MSNSEQIIDLALQARTIDEARHVQSLIQEDVGNRYQRPIGNTWNNQGILTGSGASYDHKALEVVTNMQDAVLELLAIQRFGNRNQVSYETPHEAAHHLLHGRTVKERAQLAKITIERAQPGTTKKRVTLVMRDQGCGITPSDIPESIFRVGSKHKDGYDWQQGTFGLGGATTYRNAQAIVLVTRREPTLLGRSEIDSITVAVVEWERQRTTTNAFYLVTSPWDENDYTTWQVAVPFSIPATKYPEFAPGTHLALIAYDTEGLGRRSGDEKSFDTVLNTRLFRPVIPVSYENRITRAGRVETLSGLERRMNDNPGDPGTEGRDTLPFLHHGKTFQLPIRFRLFAKPGQKGERQNFVAHGHALLVTSNGQAHSHWTPQEFKLNTKLNKLYDRILIIVESDALPLDVRTELFTADRAQLVRSAPAVRLEKEISAFLNEWAALVDANRRLIREAITGDNNSRPTLAIAEKIARALKVKGYAAGSIPAGTHGGKLRSPDPMADEDLYDNPTHFEGPLLVQAAHGKVKGIYFKLNAKDGFLGTRSNLLITCNHPEIGADEVTIGSLSSGRVRVSLAVPEGAEQGRFTIDAELTEWTKTNGGLGPKLRWTTDLEIVEKITPKEAGRPAGDAAGKRGAGDGGLVALIWKSDADEDSWTPNTVGSVEMVPAKELATRDEYKDLKTIDDEIPTVVLNRTYSRLKTYIQARAAELTDEGKEQSRERYAVGVGVGLLVLHQEEDKERKAGKLPDEAALDAGRQATARAVLSVLPDFDRIAKELED